MPILLGPDGPSLGGFVCPAVVVDAELWKLGQLKAGDTVRFRRLSLAEAEWLKEKQEQEIETLRSAPAIPAARTDFATAAGDEAILTELEPTEDRPRVVYRGAGDSYLLVEYGPLVLDLNLRFRVHVLMEWLQTKRLPGVIDLTPGIRSLQVHFDSTQLHLKQLLDALLEAESELPQLDDIEVPTRIVHLPLSWEDESTLLAIQKYMQSVRADAPWCPSNLEFIRRVNGLDSIDVVKKIVFDASYLVLGLGDVYLGAPVATPLDPRHRLVTTKYNPARTWTPENAVGIGGAYLCIYGMEGPGGYQFVGRTVQVWNRFRRTKDFSQPWLLRFFDQIRFYPVSAPELLRNRESFLEGKFDIKIEEETFRLRDYNAFLRQIAAETAVFKSKQQRAFEAERERWAATEFVPITELAEPAVQEEVALPENCSFVDAPIAGNLWKVLVEPGEIVNANQPVAIVESMKMEMQVCAIRAGKIRSVLCKELLQFLPGNTCSFMRRYHERPFRNYIYHPGAKERLSGKGILAGRCRPRGLSADQRANDNPIWIHLIPQPAALQLAGMLASDTEKPLYGIPFAVKDNIDVANVPTTAGCPAFSYVPKETATVVQRLLDAGAILIGKTNLDQFATGLVGVRSPYGACHSVFHSDYISGGSSSGSAVLRLRPDWSRLHSELIQLVPAGYRNR